jgi:hypothetical protein
MPPMLRLVPPPHPRQLESLWGGPHERSAVWAGDHWIHLDRHPRHRWREHLAGRLLLGACYGSCPDVTSIGWDVDCHGEGQDAGAAVEILVQLLWDRHQWMAFVVTSKSGHGYHVRVFFDRAVDTDRARTLALEIKRLVNRPEMCSVVPCASRTEKMAGQVLGLPFFGAGAPGSRPGGGVAVDPSTLEPLADGLELLAEWPEYDPTAALSAVLPQVAPAVSSVDRPPADMQALRRALGAAQTMAVGAPNSPDQLTLQCSLMLNSLGLNDEQRLAMLALYNARRPVPWNAEQLRRFAIDAPKACGNRAPGWRIDAENRAVEALAHPHLQTEDYKALGTSLRRRQDAVQKAAGTVLLRVALGEALFDAGTPAEQSEQALETAIRFLVAKHPDVDPAAVEARFRACVGAESVKVKEVVERAIGARPPLRTIADDTIRQPILARQERFWLPRRAGGYITCLNRFDLQTAYRGEYQEELNPLGLAQKCTHVERIEVHYSTSETRWDAARKTLIQGTPLTDRVKAQYDPEVEHWLAALAGDQEEMLLQQLRACNPKYLDSTCRATALIGPKSVGKTALTVALAKCWDSPPVKMAAAVAQFNSGLATCPIVVADEALPKDYSGEQFRDFIASHDHSIEPKGKERHPLFGCVRLFIAANDRRQIRLTGEKGQDDIAAIADRIVAIQCHPEAEQALDAIRGEGQTGVALGRIVGHLLWLWSSDPGLPTDGRFVGAEAQGIDEQTLLDEELEAGELLWDAIGRHLEDRTVERNYADVRTNAPCPGRPSESAWAAWPIIVSNGLVRVRPLVLAAALGVPVKEVREWLAPVCRAKRDSIEASGRLRRKVAVWTLDTAKLVHACGTNSDLWALDRDSRD